MTDNIGEGDHSNEDRRSFLGRVLKGLGIAGALGIFYSAVDFLSRGGAASKLDDLTANLAGMARRKRGAQNPGVKMSDDGTVEIVAESIPAGMYTVVSAGQVPVIVVNTGSTFKAFEATCAHLGCLVKWDAATSSFACPCHGGRYNADGKVIAGPPPRGLTKWKVSKVGDKIKVSPG